MSDIAIVGAGELGGSIAHAVARRNVAATICLIDDAGRVAEGKALDISQAAPIEEFATTLSGATDLASAGGAAAIVIADRAAGAEWAGEDGLMLLRRLSRLAPTAVIVCAGPSQRDLVERGVRELHLRRERVFGSAPEALVSTARALVALTINGSPRDVALSVLGLPPSLIVLPWNDATVAGFPLTSVVDEPTRRQLHRRIEAAWPPGPYALASAASKVLEGMFHGMQSVISCYVAPDDSIGTRMRTAALPVRIGPAGIESVVIPSLNVVDRIALDKAMLL
jgi:malate dehydrogenase